MIGLMAASGSAAEAAFYLVSVAHGPTAVLALVGIATPVVAVTIVAGTAALLGFSYLALTEGAEMVGSARDYC